MTGDDSISEVTDLDEDGILTTSMDKLSEKERKKLKKYVHDLRMIQLTQVKDHNCNNPRISFRKQNFSNKRTVVEMELRGIV